MAAAKGKRGGKRDGAGRKKKERPTPEPKAGVKDPLEYLLAVVADPLEDPRLRVRAAVAAAQYTNVKLHDGGKREGREAAAKAASAGKFAPSAPPKLVVNNS